MNLYKINYCDDAHSRTYLTTGTDKDEVQKREEERLRKLSPNLKYCYAYLIDEVDGHTVIVI